MKFIKKFFLFYDLLRKRRIGSYLQDTTNLLNKSGNKNFIALNFSFWVKEEAGNTLLLKKRSKKR